MGSQCQGKERDGDSDILTAGPTVTGTRFSELQERKRCLTAPVTLKGPYDQVTLLPNKGLQVF